MKHIGFAIEPEVQQLYADFTRGMTEKTWIGLFEWLNVMTHPVGDPAYYPRLM